MVVFYTLSDFSYVERAIIEGWVWLWFLQRVWSVDKFASLRWYRIRKFDLKSNITLLILLMLPTQIVFDIVWTYVKYKEGNIVDTSSGIIIPKPAFIIVNGHKVQIWSNENIILKMITEYMLACSFALQSGTLVLLQTFWSHLADQIGGKPFMKSWEFKFYVSWVFISMIIFPLARLLASHDIILVENIIQLIFAIELLIIFLLGIRNEKRLKNLLSNIRNQGSPSGRWAIVRIQYFIEMNKYLIFGTLMSSLGILIICTDAVTRTFRISRSKFLMDLLIINSNVGSLILWVTMILIIYPRYYTDGMVSYFNSELATNPSNR
ncbi:7937_t:CDS:2 [Funneliformis mosseae]|uniref:7937_t:CDS:1 n=1 Tax=Funneliformis mosseae TaxID=27381 RepID=A0A9N9GCV3_FUNMO|nr:7937_t:CDS:2 [Funneliformis mosseae]